jgi:hypothetical protein
VSMFGGLHTKIGLPCISEVGRVTTTISPLPPLLPAARSPVTCIPRRSAAHDAGGAPRRATDLHRLLRPATTSSVRLLHDPRRSSHSPAAATPPHSSAPPPRRGFLSVCGGGQRRSYWWGGWGWSPPTTAGAMEPHRSPPRLQLQEEEEERVWRRKKALAAPLSVVVGFATSGGSSVSILADLSDQVAPPPPRSRHGRHGLHAATPRQQVVADLHTTTVAPSSS